MNKAILGLGSNIAGADGKLDEALAILSREQCRVVAQSSRYSVTEPYLNQVVAIETVLDSEALNRLTKAVERELGRTPELKAAGIVPIDIDVVVYDARVLRQRDFEAPYFVPGYNEIVPVIAD